MEKAGKILILASAWVFCTCVTDYQTVAPGTDLIAYVTNDKGLLLDGAELFIYKDSAAFNAHVFSGTPAGFVSTVQTTNGIGSITKLEADVGYYVYAVYKDQSIYPGTYITYNNSKENFSLKNKLVRGSVSYIDIILKPADGFITFWTASSNTAALPIEIFYGTSTMGSVSQGMAAAPPLFGAGALTIRTKKGNITFEAKSPTGCLWNSTISLAGAQSVFYPLSDCSVGTIAFFTDNTNAARLPLTLTLNANDGLANLISVVGSIPTDCSPGNMIKAFRVPGNYTYEAISTTSLCLWTGSFSLAANQCKLIQLATCP
jgi:hypothetical protein